MKQLKFLSAGAVALVMFFSSCGTSDEKKTDETVTTDSTAATTTTETKMDVAAAKSLNNTLVMRHKVASFAKWLPVYEAHNSTRLAYGLHNYLIARGIKDSNMVMVALQMDDTAKAKQFTALPDLKAAMQKGGVIGALKILYLEYQWRDTTANGPTRVIVTHKVKDWDAWKKSFDSHKQRRMDAGLTDRVISYSAGDNHMVTAAFIINDMKKAEYFMKSKELEDKMREAGVVGPPDIFFYNVVKNY